MASNLQVRINRHPHRLETLTVQQEHTQLDDDLISISDYLLTRLEQLSVTVSISLTSYRELTHYSVHLWSSR